MGAVKSAVARLRLTCGPNSCDHLALTPVVQHSQQGDFILSARLQAFNNIRVLVFF